MGNKSENSFFGVVPATSMKTNPNMILTLQAGKFFPTLFTNVALDTDTNEPWREGKDGSTPSNVFDWQGEKWSSSSDKKDAHPNSRFTVSTSQAPVGGNLCYLFLMI